MTIILPELIDRWRAKRNGKRRYVGKVILIDARKSKHPIVIAEVYGDSLEEMRRRKHAVAKMLKESESPNDH